MECELEANGFGGYGVWMVRKRVFLVVIEEGKPEDDDEENYFAPSKAEGSKEGLPAAAITRDVSRG